MSTASGSIIIKSKLQCTRIGGGIILITLILLFYLLIHSLEVRFNDQFLSLTLLSVLYQRFLVNESHFQIIVLYRMMVFNCLSIHFQIELNINLIRSSVLSFLTLQPTFLTLLQTRLELLLSLQRSDVGWILQSFIIFCVRFIRTVRALRVL